MTRRNRITVDSFSASNFHTTESRPYLFTAPSTVWIHFTRTMTTGRKYRGVISICLLDGYVTDGASTKWPVSLLVPNWRHGDDRYNAAPTAHDVLYSVRGLIPGLVRDTPVLDLSREECDDIIRGMWRCWGMSRFLAGCADKGLECFAGGNQHWGNDGYNVRDRAVVRWRRTETCNKERK